MRMLAPRSVNQAGVAGDGQGSIAGRFHNAMKMSLAGPETVQSADLSMRSVTIGPSLMVTVHNR